MKSREKILTIPILPACFLNNFFMICIVIRKAFDVWYRIPNAKRCLLNKRQLSNSFEKTNTFSRGYGVACRFNRSPKVDQLAKMYCCSGDDTNFVFIRFNLILITNEWIFIIPLPNRFKAREGNSSVRVGTWY